MQQGEQVTQEKCEHVNIIGVRCKQRASGTCVTCGKRLCGYHIHFKLGDGVNTFCDKCRYDD